MDAGSAASTRMPELALGPPPLEKGELEGDSSAHGPEIPPRSPLFQRGEVGWIVLVVLLLSATAAWGQAVDGSRYACRPLAEALRDLQGRGLPVVFGSNLVRDDLRVEKVPPPGSPRRLLDQLLAPHGLRVQRGAGGRLLVVQAFAGSSSVPPWSSARPAARRPSDDRGGVLPAWVEPGTPELTVIDVPRRESLRDPFAVSRYLLLRLAPGVEPADWSALAFELKALIVEARSRAEGLKVALEAPPPAVERLLEHDLAPYLDAYAGDRLGSAPAADPTARRWWRPPPGGRALHPLLAGAAAGAELVLLGERLDAEHRAFLERVQATPSVDLERQPAIDGLGAGQARFLYQLDTGSYYLAAYAEPGRRRILAFSLGGRVDARSLYPQDAAIAARHLGDRTELELDGEHPFVLIELTPEVPRPESGELRVDGDDFVDPYEIVVLNQVFREREARKVRSLDVMERRHSVSHSRTARRYTWIHRVIERPGRLTEYHHLGVERNGVPIPERGPRVGRDFRAEAQVELQPLEIELDRTYRYRYLGEEAIDGHPTWKIGFEPLQDGAYLAGVVWIDRRTHAHRKIEATHVGLTGPVIQRQVTRTYRWVPDDGQCFWNWSRGEGLSVVESSTSRVSLSIDVERYGFDYNSGDIERQVRQAHASDLPIHVAIPPDGHRWLIKEEPRRRLLGRLFDRLGRSDTASRAASHQATDPSGTGSAYRRLPPARDRLGAPNSGAIAAGDGIGGRVIAGRGAYATTRDLFLIARHNCTKTISCSGLGFDVRRTDLFDNRSELYAGLYDVQGFASLAYPRVKGSRWTLTAALQHDIAYWENGVLRPGATDAYASFQQRRNSVSVAFARPLGKLSRPPAKGTLRLRGSFGFSHLGFKPYAWEATPGFRLPDDVLEQISVLELDWQRRELYSRASLELRWRGSQEPWGVGGSEPLTRAPGRLTLIAGTSTSLPGERSLGARAVLQAGWDLDHFSDSFSGFEGARAPGFQPQRYDFGAGAGVSWNGRLAPRLPLTLRLEGAVLRSQRYPHNDAEQLGVEVETFLNTWPKIDLFLRVGYGLYSSIPDQDGDLRSRFVLSRRF